MTRVARREADKVRTELGSLSDDTARALDDVRSELDRCRADAASLRDDAGSLDARLATVLEDLGATRTALEELSKLQAEGQATASMLEHRTRELSVVVDSFRFSIELLFGPTGRYASRLLTPVDLDELIREFEWVEDPTGVAVALHFAYRTLIELELRCVGRFAGSTQNIVAKLAALTVLPLPSTEVLEIGTLFGVGAVGIARQVGRIGADAHLTIVDPFAGYQIQPDRGGDLDISGTPATREVVTTNLALGGLAPDRYRLIEGRSGDADVRQTAADRRYGLVVIDGDHSKEVALDDLIWAESLVEPGALVILDDFGDPAWAGVAEALEEYRRRPAATLALVGTAGTTAFLRAPATVASN